MRSHSLRITITAVFYRISSIFFPFCLIVELTISEEDKFDILEEADLRDVISNRKKQKMEIPESSPLQRPEDDELRRTQQQLKDVTEKMEIMRQEMLALQSGGVVRYALGFDPVEFNKLKFTESLQWVTTNLVVSMKQEMENFPEYFRCIKEIGNVMEIGNKACAGYNRGVGCCSKWHTYFRNTGHREKEELRLHCCVLCMEALGVLSGHPLIKCPWIMATTWINIQ